MRIGNIRRSVLAALVKDPRIVQGSMPTAAEVVAEAKRRAPKASGAGAASIHAEKTPSGSGWRVGWDKDHYYMRYAEFGTKDRRAQPFLRPAADRLRKDER